MEAEVAESALDSAREACERANSIFAKPSFSLIFFSFLWGGLMTWMGENIKKFTMFLLGDSTFSSRFLFGVLYWSSGSMRFIPLPLVGLIVVCRVARATPRA